MGGARATSFLKRLTYLQRRDDLDRTQFGQHWESTHAEIAKSLPGVLRYRQNHVLETYPVRAGTPPYEFDGIVELWFSDPSAVEAAFRSDVADRLATDERVFLSGLTGGAVTASDPPRASSYRLWLVGLSASPSEQVVRRSAAGLAEQAGALNISVDTLLPQAPVLWREGLRRVDQLPTLAVSLGFDGEREARAAAVAADIVTPVTRWLERPTVALAREVTII